MIPLTLFLSLFAAPPQEEEFKNTKEAMQAVQDVLIGKFRCTGTWGDRKKEGWLEKISWSFKIKDEEYSLRMTAEKSPLFKRVVLRYNLKEKRYELDATTPEGKSLTYIGNRDGKNLTLERTDEAKGENQRLVYVLLRFNRYLLRVERKPVSSSFWRVIASVGCTKEGVPFVRESNGPKCIVTGGYGSMTLDYKGKTYYIC